MADAISGATLAVGAVAAAGAISSTIVGLYALRQSRLARAEEQAPLEVTAERFQRLGPIDSDAVIALSLTITNSATKPNSLRMIGIQLDELFVDAAARVFARGGKKFFYGQALPDDVLSPPIQVDARGGLSCAVVFAVPSSTYSPNLRPEITATDGLDRQVTIRGRPPLP